jgi:hypothetical protein
MKFDGPRPPMVIFEHTRDTDLPSSDTALYPHEYRNLLVSQMTDETNKDKERIHTVRPAQHENPEELQLRHNNEKNTFLIVLLIFAKCNTHYSSLVT